MRIKLNGEFFKRGSTWLNIGISVGTTALVLLEGLPANVGVGYVCVSIGMAIMQGVKVEIRQNGIN